MPETQSDGVDELLEHVNTCSAPSQLKITDLRIAKVGGWPLIRLDTNQDVYGLGEVRDGASPTYALFLKSRLLGENPCHVEKLFRKIKQFGHHGRQGGGVSGIEMALMDLAGKAYGVPAYQLLGGKYRDKIRIYCDTDATPDPAVMGQRLQARLEQGFTFLKMDVGLGLCRGLPNTVAAPSGMLETYTVMHPFTGIRLTDQGIAVLCEYVGAVRDIIGYEVPLALDHFGHLGIESCIRLAQALDPYCLAWLEDMVPWQFADQLARLARSCQTPICTGEDIYGKEEFRRLFEAGAVGVCHPDLATAGGLMETKKIGDLAQEYGVSMALHNASSPVCALANVHCAAATENFLALENHAVDLPWWDDLVTGLPKPIIQNGYIPVPDTPGLGVELNPEVVKEHLDPNSPGYFEPTPEWDHERSHDRLWS
jgi:L-alanine-DL-glutamate epimerase-like enolase superfamily enzyme